MTRSVDFHQILRADEGIRPYRFVQTCHSERSEESPMAQNEFIYNP